MRLYLTLCLILLSLSVKAAEDNIVIETLTDTYTIIASDGRPESVKNVEKSVYTALRYDAEALAMAGYGGSVSIDKATAPGAKPIYRQWIDDYIFYEDSRICFMEVPVKVGKPAKVEFQRTYKQPEQFDKIMMISNYPVRRYVAEVIVPASLSSVINISTYAFPADASFEKEEGKDGSVTYRATIENMEAFKNEQWANPASVIAPALIVTGMFDGLDGLYSYLNGFLDDEPADDAVCTLASQLTADCRNDIEKANAVASWVRQNIRYIAIEHGEWAFRPEKASEVFAKRYGDCKGSANLIKAMLRCVGIDGRICWIGTDGSVPHDWKEVPALCSGNHCIAAAVVGDSILYLDGTVSYCPPGYLPKSIQGRPVIIENGDSYIYASVPMLPVSTSTMTYYADMTLNPESRSLEGEMTVEMTGSNRISFLNRYYSLDMSRRSLFLDVIITAGAKSVAVTDAILEHGELCDSTLTISAKITDSGAVAQSDGALYVRMSPNLIPPLQTIETDGRKHPLGTFLPLAESFFYTVNLPEGWEPASMPEPAIVINKWFSYVANYTYDAGERMLKAECAIVINRVETPVEELKDYNKAVKTLIKSLSTWISIVKQD